MMHRNRPTPHTSPSLRRLARPIALTALLAGSVLASTVFTACVPGAEPADGMDAALRKETAPGPFCGNNRVEWQDGGAELCDGADLNGETCDSLGYEAGTLGCSTECSAFDVSACLGEGVCGNGITDTGEECDDGLEPSQVCDVYDESCFVCTSECTLADGAVRTCGDGVRDVDRVSGSTVEVCDGADVSGTTCEDLGFPDGGVLGCQDDCGNYDLTGCLGDQCGDGVVGDDEVCEPEAGYNGDCPYGDTSCTLCSWECILVDGETSYCGDGQVDWQNDETCELGQTYISACSGETMQCDSNCRWEEDECVGDDVNFADGDSDAGPSDVDLDAEDVDLDAEDVDLDAEDVDLDAEDVQPDGANADASGGADANSSDAGATPTLDEDSGCSAAPASPSLAWIGVVLGCLGIRRRTARTAA